MAAVSNTNAGTVLWDYGSTLVSEVVKGINDIKGDPDIFHNALDFAVNILRGWGHLYGSTLKSVVNIAGSAAAVIDVVAVVVDGPRLVDAVIGAYKHTIDRAEPVTYKQKKDEREWIWKLIQATTFFTADVIGVTMWLGECGFAIPGAIAAGLGGTVLVGGTAVAVTAGTIIGGITTLGFLAMVGNEAQELCHAENKEQTIYHAIALIRSITEVAARLLFIGAVVTSSMSVMLPGILALGVIAATLAIGGFLYKREREKVIEG